MRTKLGRKFLRQAILIGSIGSLAIGLVSFGVLNQQAQIITQQQVLNSSERAKALIQFLPNELVSRVNDWGNWDESYTFALGRNPSFATEYVNAKVVSDAGVDAVVILRSDGTLAAHFLKNEISGLQSAWLTAATDQSIRSRILSHNTAISGYEMIGGRLFVIAASRIKPTNYSNETSGFIIMGREVLASQLSTALQSPTYFSASGDKITKINGPSAKIEIPINSINSNKSISIFIETHLHAASIAQSQKLIQSSFLFILSLITALLMLRVIEKMVTKRIIFLERQMDSISKKDFTGLLPEDSFDDEISSLTSKFNQLLTQLSTKNGEERQLRKEAQHALDIAVKAERAKSNFIAVTSHEIRTLLAAVLGGIELLQTKSLDPDLSDIAKRLENSGERLRNVVDDVLDFSRIEHEGVPIEISQIDFNECVRKIVENYSSQANGKGLDLIFNPFTQTEYTVLTDQFRIQQVLGNLISNAIKFTDAGSVTVSVKRTGDGHTRVEVDDTGVGINADQAEHLFRPFVQADRFTVRRFGGTGLGLSICKRIVEAMGGEIGIINKPGLGSTFWFELALEDGVTSSNTKQQPITANSTPMATITPLSILVVEDNQMVQSILQDQLSMMGHQPTCVANGVAAFNAVAAGSFDAVLMDMHMPLMDGVAATKAIRALGQARGNLPIIALTADADQSRRGLYNESEFHAFLTKPCNTSNLAAALENVTPQPQIKKRPNNAPTIDPSLLTEIEQTMGKDALGRYLKQFIEQLDPAINEILSNDGHDKDIKVAEAAHKLKGSALSIGATRMQKVLASLEVRARSGMNWQGLRSALIEAAEDLKIVIEAMNNSTLSEIS